MGYIPEELVAHLFHLFLLLDILLELVIGTFELGDRLLQLFGHPVEVAPQDPDLIRSPARILCIKVQIRHFLREMRQFHQRLRDPPRQKPHKQTADNNTDAAQIDQELIRQGGAFSDTCQRALHHEP